jgi:hypothetical protein
MKPADRDPVLDRLLSQAELRELPLRDHAVLASRDRGHAEITWAHLLSYVDVRCAQVPHSARMEPGTARNYAQTSQTAASFEPPAR